MGSSPSAPRHEDSPCKPPHPPRIAVEELRARKQQQQHQQQLSSESDDDESSGVAAVDDASPSSSEPRPLDHPSPEALARMCSAVTTLIEGLGEDSGREGLFDTPKRVAKAWIDATSGYRQTVSSTVGGALFTEPSLAPPDDAPLSSGGIVLVRDVEFASTSSRDLLPFYGKLHLAYVPRGGVVLGLSKVARLAKLFSRRLTTQRELTRDLLAALDNEVRPAGACVLVEATHLAHGPAARRAVTTACSGVFLNSSSNSDSNSNSGPSSSDSNSSEGPDVEEFLDLLRLSGVDPLAGGWESEGEVERRRSGDDGTGGGNNNAASTSPPPPPPFSSSSSSLPLPSSNEHHHRGKSGRPSARPSSPGEVVVGGGSSSSSSSKTREREEVEEEEEAEANFSPSSSSATAAPADAAAASSSSPPARPVTPGLGSSEEEDEGEAAAGAAASPSAKEAAAAVAETTTSETTTATTAPLAQAPTTPNGGTTVAAAIKTTANGTRVPPSCSSSVFGEDGSESDFGGGGGGNGGGGNGDEGRQPKRDASASSTSTSAVAVAGTPRTLAQSAGSSFFVHGGEIAAANRSRRGSNGDGNDGGSDDGGDAAAAAASLLHLPVSPAAAARRSPPLAPGTRQAMEDAVRALLAEVVGGGGGGGGGKEESRNAVSPSSSSPPSPSPSSSRLAALEGAPRRYVEFLLASTAGYGAAPVPPTPAPGTFATKLPRRTAPCGCGHEETTCSISLVKENTSSSSPSNSSLPLPFATPDRPTFDPAVPDFQASLRFTSQCEHHMLPFHGVARLAVVGASRSNRRPGGPLLLPTLKEVEGMVAAFSHRLQVQERLTQQLTDGLVAACSEEGEEDEDENENEGSAAEGRKKRNLTRGPAGVLVLCEAAHLCMVSRGVEKHASSTVTLAGRGVLASGAGARRELVRRLAGLEAE